MNLTLLRLDTYCFYCREHRVRERVVSERYILKNTESVVSGLIQTKVFLENIEFESGFSIWVDTDLEELLE